MTDDHEHGPHTHTHDDWEPSRVVARLKRDGFCAHPVTGGFCMRRPDTDPHEHQPTKENA